MTLPRASPSAVRPRLLLGAAVATLVGCAAPGGGCGVLAPLASRFEGPRSDDALHVRVSADGVAALNQNWRLLVGALAPGGVLTLGVPCARQSFNLGLLGTLPVTVADQGRANGVGRLDGVCGNDDPAQITATITGFSLVPTPADTLEATVTLQFATGPLYALLPTFLCDVRCSVDFASARAGRPDNTLAVRVRFTIDPRWDRLLAFRVGALEGASVCGAAGASPAPRCIDPADVALRPEGGLCSASCALLDIAPVKSFVLGLISPVLQTRLQEALAGQRCQACASARDCPPSTDGSGAVATCSGGLCLDPRSGECTPRFLGTQGRLDLGSLLGAVGAPPGAALDLTVAAGSRVVVDQGVLLGTRLGLQPAQASACVPPVPPPALTLLEAPDFDPQAAPGSRFHLGLAVSQGALDRALWAAHQSGALCLRLDTALVPALNTGLLKPLLPSLGALATRDGKDAPVLITVRPARPPTAAIGRGGNAGDQPLLTLSWPEVAFDLYVLLDDRWARLFTVTADLRLPLSLRAEGCDRVRPVLGSLAALVTNARASASELLAEDPQALVDLVPALAALAEPALAGALGTFTLPTVAGFALSVSEAKGLTPIAGTERFEHLGLYARLLPPDAGCAP